MLKVLSSKIERCFFAILSTGHLEKHHALVAYPPLTFTCDIEKCQLGLVCLTLVMKTFDMRLPTPQRNALLGSQFVLALALQISISGPSVHRLNLEI